MSLIEECVYCRGVSKERFDFAVDFMASLALGRSTAQLLDIRDSIYIYVQHQSQSRATTPLTLIDSLC